MVHIFDLEGRGRDRCHFCEQPDLYSESWPDKLHSETGKKKISMTTLGNYAIVWTQNAEGGIDLY